MFKDLQQRWVLGKYRQEDAEAILGYIAIVCLKTCKLTIQSSYINKYLGAVKTSKRMISIFVSLPSRCSNLIVLLGLIPHLVCLLR